MTAPAPAAFGAQVPILCAVTDRTRLVGIAPTASSRDAIEALVAQAAAAADGGLDLLQIREPDLPAAALLEIADRAREAAQGSGLRVLVNDRLDIALAARLHGVHLRGASFAAARARAIVPSRAGAVPAFGVEAAADATSSARAAAGAAAAAAAAGPFLIGRSVHSADEAAAAEGAGGLDYLILGAMFPTASKPPDHALAGVETLRDAVNACRLPIIAIGGITLENAAAVVRAGAAGLAAIGLFATVTPRTMRDTAARLRQIFAAAPRRA